MVVVCAVVPVRTVRVACAGKRSLCRPDDRVELTLVPIVLVPLPAEPGARIDSTRALPSVEPPPQPESAAIAARPRIAQVVERIVIVVAPNRTGSAPLLDHNGVAANRVATRRKIAFPPPLA